MRKTVILIDDDPVVLAQQATKFAMFPNVIVIGTFTSIPDAHRFLVAQRIVADIICCDIDMPGINGIDGVASLVGKYRLLAFVTGFPEYALGAYEKGVDMYILKPLTEGAVQDILLRFERFYGFGTLQDAPTGYLVVSGFQPEQFVNVELAKMTKICANDHVVDVYAPERVGYKRISMEDIVTQLAPTDWFIRVNKSNVLALSYVVTVRAGYLYTRKEGEKFRLGDVFGPQVREFLKRNEMRRGRG